MKTDTKQRLMGQGSRGIALLLLALTSELAAASTGMLCTPTKTYPLRGSTYVATTEPTPNSYCPATYNGTFPSSTLPTTLKDIITTQINADNGCPKLYAPVLDTVWLQPISPSPAGFPVGHTCSVIFAYCCAYRGY